MIVVLGCKGLAGGGASVGGEKFKDPDCWDVLDGHVVELNGLAFGWDGKNP